MSALLLLAFVGGAVVAGLYVLPEIRHLRAELEIAQERLYASWQKGDIIAPRPADTPDAPPDPLEPELQEMVDEWESPETRAAIESKLRYLRFTKGLSPKDALIAYQLEQDDGEQRR